MSFTFVRQTVCQSVVFEGIGLHSGIPVRVTVHPSRQGIAFRRGAERWPAKPEHVTDTTRCTRLGSVSTVEHLMSALAGLGVTDAEVEVEGPELPSLDGAAATFCLGLLDQGLCEVGEAVLEGPFSRVFCRDGESRISVASGEGRWRYTFSTDGRWPGSMSFECVLTPQSYLAEVAPAKTFAFEEELPMIRAAGLGQGLGETNAFLIGPEGLLGAAQFADEPARHKMLDLIGDLYLSGVPPQALSVTAERNGHRANVEAAARLARSVTVRLG